MSAGKQSATAFLQIDFTATALVGGHSQFRDLAREGKSGQKEVDLSPACSTKCDFTLLRTKWNQPHIEKEANRTKVGKQKTCHAMLFDLFVWGRTTTLVGSGDLTIFQYSIEASWSREDNCGRNWTNSHRLANLSGLPRSFPLGANNQGSDSRWAIKVRNLNESNKTQESSTAWYLLPTWDWEEI